jgi:hypothetical protein
MPQRLLESPRRKGGLGFSQIELLVLHFGPRGGLLLLSVPGFKIVKTAHGKFDDSILALLRPSGEDYLML